jgi:hypothetical protein
MKQPNLMRRSTVLSHLLQYLFLGKLSLTKWENTDQIGKQELLTELEGLSTADLLALTNLEQILLNVKYLFPLS